MDDTTRPATNRLIASLPAADAERLQADCQSVELVFGETLVEERDIQRYVYFPTDSFISLIATLDEGERLEVGLIGDEGMMGASIVLGVDDVPLTAVVQGAGPALRLSAAAFRRHLEASSALRLLLDRYIYVLLNQLSRTAICTHYHRIEARLARWLLMTRDRAHCNQFKLTQEFLAYMLGVRRVGITDAAGALQERGLISYSRGNVTILDAFGLEKAACRCYRDTKTMYKQMLGPRFVSRGKSSVMVRKLP